MHMNAMECKYYLSHATYSEIKEVWKISILIFVTSVRQAAQRAGKRVSEMERGERHVIICDTVYCNDRLKHRLLHFDRYSFNADCHLIFLFFSPCACYQLRFSLCCAHIEKWMYLTAKLSFQLFNKQRIQLKVKEWLHRKPTVRGGQLNCVQIKHVEKIHLIFFYWFFHSFRSHCKVNKKILNRLKWFIFITGQ